MKMLKEYKIMFLDDDKGNVNYEKNINDFINYLVNIVRIEEIHEVGYDNFLKSLEYLVTENKIKRERTSDRYLEAVKSFYKFLKINNYAEDIFERATYKEDYEEFIAKIEFKDPINNKDLNVVNIKNILSFIDDYFIRFNDYSRLKSNNERAEMNRYFKYLKLRLLIKITLLAPSKKNVISDIEFKHFSETSRTIKINEIRFELTNSLYRDLIEYRLFLLKYIIYDKERDKYEKKYYKTYIFGDNDDFYTMLNDYLNQLVADINKSNPEYKIPNMGHESLRKTAITAMVNSNIDIRIISKLSGNDVSTLAQQYYKDDLKKNVGTNDLLSLKYLKYI